MKRLLVALCAMLPLCALQLTASAQANDWVIPPRTVITFGSSTSVSLLSSSSALAACSASAADKYAWTLSGSYSGTLFSGGGIAFVNGCGIYDMSGGAVGSGTSADYQNIFSVPGLCNTYFAVQWENVSAPFHFNKLTLRTLDIGSAVTQSASTDLINDGNMHLGVTAAAAPLESNGDRMVYASSDLDLIRYQFDNSGTLVSTTTIATLPNYVDSRTGMEVSPDGSKIMLSTGNTLYMYDIAASTFTALGSFAYNVAIAGFEYVPLSTGDRVYFSYNYYDGFNTLNGLDYVTLSAPTTNVDAIPGVTGSAKYAYGFTDIERGRDGLLYFAYHNNYTSHSISSGDVGTLMSMSTSASSPSTVYDGGGSAVQVRSLTNLGYIIQKQIDGEDYGSLYGGFAPPSFTFRNSVTASWSPVPNIYFSGGRLMMNLAFHGPHEWYTLKVETGTVSFPSGGGTTFTPDATQPSPYAFSDIHYSGKLAMNLTNYVWDNCGGSWLNDYRGPIRVTVEAWHTVCPNALVTHYSTSEVYNLIDPVYFLMNSPVDAAGTHVPPTNQPVCNSSQVLDACTGDVLLFSKTGAQDRNPVFDVANDCGPRFGVFGTNTNQDNLIMDNTEAPACEQGWQGASTTGLYYSSLTNFNNLYLINFGTINRYEIEVEEFDQLSPGAALTNGSVVFDDNTITTNLSTGGIPSGGYNFNVPSANYFTTQYGSIAGSRSTKVYKVTYTQYATGGDCDTASSVSYFRILDDGTTSFPSPGGYQWRIANVNSGFRAFPNPVTDILQFEWTDDGATGSRSLAATNALGQTVLSRQYEETKGGNRLRIDVSSLAPGLYHYSAYANGQEQKGTFVKE